ncbi:MAG: hypothetical protein FWC32_10365 [Firmicutes bacterium]|nr:hypothetical protein [Bacillota bacterium]
MFGGVDFELFQESDAQQVADMLNRNRFHSARNGHITAELYLFLRRCRGSAFTILAKKNGKVVGIAGAYPTSDNHVAKNKQIYIGTFLVDIQYRLSYSVIMGLYDAISKEFTSKGYMELISLVRPQNESSYNLMIKCGYVLIDNTPNDFGRMKLNNFAPTLSNYIGETAEITNKTIYTILPVVDKKEARKMQGKPLIHGRYIECNYQLARKNVVLLFDTVNYKVDGAIVPMYCKLYPDFYTKGRYILENLRRLKSITLPVELVMEPESGVENMRYEITLEAGQSQAVECSESVSEFRFLYNNVWYRLHPNKFEEVIIPKEPIRLECGKLSVKLEPSTGFMSVMSGETKLTTLVWPCPVIPYLEGLFDPRIKELDVVQTENCLTITEETDSYKLTRICLLSENKMDVTTTFKCKTDDVEVRPITQIYAEKGVQGYAVKSGDRTMDFNAQKIKHIGYEFSDYTYWDSEPERYVGFPVEILSFKYPSSAVDIAIDKKCKFIDHAPVFVSTLDFDGDKLLDEQVIEQIQVNYRTEDV